MKDCNGKEVSIGDRVVIVRDDDRGKIATVRNIQIRPHGKRIPQCRVDDGTSETLDIGGDWTFSVWLESKEFAKI